MNYDVLERWTVEQAAETYGIHEWSAGHFDISSAGEIIVRESPAAGQNGVSLYQLVKELRAEEISAPIFFRFSNLIRSRVQRLNNDFRDAMKEANYKGSYRPVFPIKVNQHHEVIDDIVTYGRPYGMGLECGSKAELIIAVSQSVDPNALLICNGYKDEEFIDLALMAQKMGIDVHLVIEMPGELPLILERAAQLGVRPSLGIRAKLSSRAGGHWDSSGGDRSKFGIDAAEIIALVDKLRDGGMLDCLKMLHYHLGSQVPDIRKIRNAISEAVRIYADLVREGAPMGILNVGGGLAVDYDGSHSNFASSCNYSTREYAADIIEGIMLALDEGGVPHPTIVSESGRAIVAHHGVLVFNILDTKRLESREVPESVPGDASESLHNIFGVYRALNPRDLQEAFHDAVYYRDDIRNQFMHGVVALRERALCENIFWHIIRRIASLQRDAEYVPEEMQALEAAISDQYYGNFSIFQSLPDAWAVGQMFPIMPIHHLNTRPTRKAVVADITCDSDGKIDKFTDLHDVKRNLLLHEIGDSDYYLGVFLVGAYQETLGDMHNLLGDVNVVQVEITEEGAARIRKTIAGDTIDEILKYIEYDTADIVESIRALARRALAENRLSPDEQRKCVESFITGLHGYTYFEE